MTSASPQHEPRASGKPSEDARALVREALVFDLHIDSFIPVRLWGYDLTRAHRRNPGWLFGHLDLPRAAQSGLDGGMWSITTNPFRLRPWPNFLRNVANLRALARRCGAHIATRASDVRAARARGEHAIIMSVQGANALSSPEQVAQIPNDIVLRMTLVHLTPSWIGAPSSPGHWLRRRKGLTPEGRALVHAMNARRVLVDLAHLHRGGFRDAVEAHDRSLPFVVTHGGVDAVHPHWRNVNDEEIRAVANSGGVVGVITAGLYLGPPGRGRSGAERWVDHLEHLIRVGGEDVAAVGTDFDGFIIPARGIRGAHAYPLLVDAMLRRGLSDRVVRKVLGENALRVLEELRG